VNASGHRDSTIELPQHCTEKSCRDSSTLRV